MSYFLLFYVCIATCFRSILSIFLVLSLFLIYLHLHIWNNFFCRTSSGSLVQNEQCRLRLISPTIRAIICLMEYFFLSLYITNVRKEPFTEEVKHVTHTNIIPYILLCFEWKNYIWCLDDRNSAKNHSTKIKTNKIIAMNMHLFF